MRWMQWKLAALGAALVLAGCGGGGDSRPFYSGMVTFGDSLSDVGTYKVGTVAAVGGGKWTVNSSTARNWTEVVAVSAGMMPLCAAQTGLLPNIPGLTGAPVTNVAGCTSYAQGSARVSNPIGPNSVALQAAPFNQMTLGLMATPLATQISRHLAGGGGSFLRSQLITVQAGGNDLFMNFAGIANASAGGSTAVGAALAAGWSAEVQTAVAAGGSAATDAAINAALTAMAQAGAELAGLIKTQLVARGARYVVVSNLPDVSQTPFALGLDASSRGLINTMVTSFNDQLQAGLAGTPVLLVDAYARGRAQAASPAAFGLANVTTPACSTTSPANPLQGSSLTCTPANLIPGDTSGYLYADSVHPTPLGYQLFAQYVIERMQMAGWL